MNQSMKKYAMLAGAAAVMMTAAAGSAIAGAEARCKACHSFEKGVPGRVGPNLIGVIGRKAGQVEGFKYSKALKESGITWTEANIRKWIEDSQKMVPGVRMPSQKLTGPKADEVIAFLKANS